MIPPKSAVLFVRGDAVIKYAVKVLLLDCKCCFSQSVLSNWKHTGFFEGLALFCLLLPPNKTPWLYWLPAAGLRECGSPGGRCPCIHLWLAPGLPLAWTRPSFFHFCVETSWLSGTEFHRFGYRHNSAAWPKPRVRKSWSVDKSCLLSVFGWPVS